MTSTLRAVPLFAGLSDDDLRAIETQSETLTLAPGERLFAEGDQGAHAYVIVSGEIEIQKHAGGRDVLLAVRRPGEVIGEMALLQDEPRSASGSARSESEVVAIPKAVVDDLMASNLSAVRALFQVVLDRWKSTQALLRQSEKMAQLGTMTAGLAHELNNPAAAVSRAATQLRTSVDELVTSERSLVSSGQSVAGESITGLRSRLYELDTADSSPTRGSSFDTEDEVERVLRDAGLAEPWRLAPAIIDAGLDQMVEELVAAAGDQAGDLVQVLVNEHEVSSLLHEVEEGTRRLSAIVRALKSYSYLDQGPVQQVDLVTGLEDTLLILKSKLAGITIEREFGSDVPTIQAYGGELNQVWTNLIDNAADAIEESGSTDGRITLRTRREFDHVIVEVENNGPQIPPETIGRVFDSFYTTKPPGSGTGLGLNITYAIVVDKHGGDITVESDPARTVFRVTLPMKVPE